MVTDLQSETNRLDRLFKRFTDQSRAVTISSISLVVALLSVLLSGLSQHAAIKAELRSEMQTQIIEELQGDIDVYRIRAAKLNAYLAAHGINTEEIYDE